LPCNPVKRASLTLHRIAGIEHPFDLFNITAPTDTQSRERVSPVDTTPAPRLVELSAADLRAHLDEALAVYVEAMNYPRGTELHRAPMWAEHATRPGWRAIAAFTTPHRDTGAPNGDAGASAHPGTSLVGIAYGYRGAPHQWWHQQVREGLRRSGADRRTTESILGDYFELTELHVSPRAQGHGTGAALLTALLAGRPEARVLLSTPEVPLEDNRAWRLYRRLGFTDVVRHFRFSGDSRPFAVLGRELPLHGPTAAPGVTS
jgi:ribosomal protein S18 acetylase RimI-like enzyme